MTQEPLTLTTADGWDLAGELHLPAGPHRANLLIAGAMGVKRQFYHGLAGYLAEHGIRVLTFDYRGIGGSLHGAINDCDAHLVDWGRRDLATAISTLDAGSHPLLYLGHSVGGQIMGLAENAKAIRGALFIASQHGAWKSWDGADQLKIRLLWFVLMPNITRVLGHWPSAWFGMGERLPRDVALTWSGSGRLDDYIKEFVDEDLRSRYDLFTGRLHSISISDDWLAPKKAAVRLLSYYPRATEATHEEITPDQFNLEQIDHFGFFRSRHRETLWPYALNRLQEYLS